MREAAVFGVAHEKWGETPLAAVILHESESVEAAALKEWINQRVGAKLFTEALRHIRQAGGRRVWFNWADGRAKRFYERFDLKVTRRFVVLRKDLSGMAPK